MKEEIAIFWFRRDLRLDDNAGLFRALKSGLKVLPLFIFDKNILDKLEEKKDRRVDFIHQAVFSIKKQLNMLDSDLLVKYGLPNEIWESLLGEFSIKKVFCNHDYEKYATDRDLVISNLCEENHVEFYSFKDQCVFEKSEVLSATGTPYTVFTPYMRKWKEKMNGFYKKSYPNEKYFNKFLKIENLNIPSLKDIGFVKTEILFSKPTLSKSILTGYKEKRDFPGINATSRLSIHLRFGTISIRKCVQYAEMFSETWLNELIWRDFYMNILANFPQINARLAFKKAYDKIPWRNSEAEFKAWCEGKTGYWLVDAGMRELNNTGFMHNRVRMVVASFLCKHLLIDWRWGEAYFAQKLNDFDFSANNGGWQWASSSGCDAAPYFRIFNPESQTLKFDKELTYIKKWVPEFLSSNYPKPIVDHKMARERALKVYKEALNEAE
ncbi:deoxyribodipyrimidine photo-lyase [Lacihabitans sp. CS3-21]|uniref:cryptochrome/photolyase family protein n=1 Tax=Lacihabitans sp. CS3-21 TaxID=2487332 RepID=UPI0020CE8C98|nr:deoxyribodipyrimidine photo-lyase [Lacihabitans sp. CS3-21]MCP9748308.1 deoxyribodipyrimidine photo-lyase [Lacihabitans sp. CS3-21]